jgi:molecular chaperone GrpE
MDMSEHENKENLDTPPLSAELENALKEAQDHADALSEKEQKSDVAPSEESVEDDQEAHVQSDQVDDTSAVESEIKSLKAQLEAAQKNASDFKEAMLRARADLENARRRFERTQSEDKKFASEKTLKALIPVVDDLDLALSNVSEDQDTSLIEGVRLVHKKFIQVLEAQGANTFYPQGEAFDPTLHEAMMESPSTDVPPGHILQVFQRGWMLQDRLLRPAKVILACE